MINLVFLAEEFAAHGANVNCASLGKKSGRVLVTGGDDKNVNLWAVGKSKCLMVRNIIYSNLKFRRSLTVGETSLLWGTKVPDDLS